MERFTEHNSGWGGTGVGPGVDNIRAMLVQAMAQLEPKVAGRREVTARLQPYALAKTVPDRSETMLFPSEMMTIHDSKTTQLRS